MALLATQERQGGIANLVFSTEESTEITGASLSMDWEMGNGMRLKSITAFRSYEGLKGNLGINPVVGLDVVSARVTSSSPGATYGYVGPTTTTFATALGELGARTSLGVVVDPQDLLGGGWTTVGNPVPEGTLVSVFRSGRESEQSQISQEFQLSGDIGERADFVAGLYYFAEEADERNPQISLSPGLFYAGIVGGGLPGILGAFASTDSRNAKVAEEATAYSNTANTDPGGLGACGGTLITSQAESDGVSDADPLVRGPAIGALGGTILSKYLGPCFNSSVLGGNPGFVYGTDNTALAVYGHVRYQLTERLDLGVGLRYTQDTREGYLHTASNASTDSAGNRLGDKERLSGEDDYDKLDFSVSLAYQANEDLNFYGKVASGYRSGGFNVRAASADSFKKAGGGGEPAVLRAGGEVRVWGRSGAVQRGRVPCAVHGPPDLPVQRRHLRRHQRHLERRRGDQLRRRAGTDLVAGGRPDLELEHGFCGCEHRQVERRYCY